MHEVRVESLEKLESLGGEVWISANSGELNVVFSRAVWEEVLSSVSNPTEPTEAELEELESLQKVLEELSSDGSFEEVHAGESEEAEFVYDLVLKSRELYAVATGYLFVPVVEASIVERARAALEHDDFVEQAYVIGAIADESVLMAGDEDLRIVSVRGRESSASRFEMAPELWRALSGKLRWSDVQTVISEESAKISKENKG